MGDELLFSVALPLPPSVNHGLMPVRMGRIVRLVKTPHARAWAAEADKFLAEVKKPDAPLAVPVVLDCIFFVPSISSDCSNRCKPLEDALVRAGVLADDRVVAEVRLEKRIAPSRVGGWVDVDVRLASPHAHAELAARLAAAEERAEASERRTRAKSLQRSLPGLSSASYLAHGRPG